MVATIIEDDACSGNEVGDCARDEPFTWLCEGADTGGDVDRETGKVRRPCTFPRS